MWRKSHNILQNNYLDTISPGGMARRWPEARSPGRNAAAQKLRVFGMNPRRAHTPGEAVTVAIDPHGVVLLTE